MQQMYVVVQLKEKRKKEEEIYSKIEKDNHPLCQQVIRESTTHHKSICTIANVNGIQGIF